MYEYMPNYTSGHMVSGPDLCIVAAALRHRLSLNVLKVHGTCFRVTSVYQMRASTTCCFSNFGCTVQRPSHVTQHFFTCLYVYIGLSDHSEWRRDLPFGHRNTRGLESMRGSRLGFRSEWGSEFAEASPTMHQASIELGLRNDEGVSCGAIINKETVPAM